MKNSFSLQQISRTGNVESNLISRQYKLNLMADFMRNIYENQKLNLYEITKQLGCSTSTLPPYRIDINLPSLHSIHPNYTNKRAKKASNTKFDNNSHREHHIKRPQMTSNYLKKTITNTKSDWRNKYVLEAGSMQENIEINYQYSDDIVRIKIL